MKILVVRLSSIGDIVLTTPVVRAMKMQLPHAEIHYLTKRSFASLLQHNPHISKLHLIDKRTDEILEDLQKEGFDHIIDLHHNLRTFKLKRQLKIASTSFRKLNISKWLLVNFKWNRMPDMHIVDRYFKAAEFLGVRNDQQPCEIFLTDEDQVDVQHEFGLIKCRFIAVAIGAQYATKRMPEEVLIKIISEINVPVLLMGGPTDVELANSLIQKLPGKEVLSACGKYSLLQSADIVRQAGSLITNDTGMMHIASCFGVPTVSVWGNTVPELGMYPYFPSRAEKFSVHQVEGLSCRPCSKIGFQSCPKKHFKCMLLQDTHKIAVDAAERLDLFFEE